MKHLLKGGIVAAAVLSFTGTASAASFVTDTVNGANDDNFASGGVFDGLTQVADWSINTTVSGTDFTNLNVIDGALGVEYQMRNAVTTSSDTNTVTFSLSDIVGDFSNIIVSQSAYSNAGGWNGSSSEPAQFTLSWLGGGQASILDPDDQLAGLGSGDLISSGTTIAFSSFQSFNSQDSWSIALPDSVAEVSVDWAALGGSSTTALNVEWVTFDANITASVATTPEPGTLVGAALVTGLGLLLGKSKQKSA